jgi:hypothetical protein
LAADWVATASADGARLTGYFAGWEWEGWARHYHSLERLLQPAPGYLTGTASSLSADWFDAPMGIPEPVPGQAEIVH